MTNLRRVLSLVLVALAFISSTRALATQQAQTALFNGKNLDGWEHVGPGSFVVEDGLLKTQGGMGLLWYSQKKIGRTKLRVVFKLTGKESDSGVFIRIPEKPTEPWVPVNRGYEVEIGDWPDDYSCTGVLYTFTKALARPIKPLGEWNTLEIKLDGPHIVVFLNGVKVTDYREGDPVPPKPAGSIDPDRGPRREIGYIGLQNHPGDPVYFKEVTMLAL
jgi:3-keto-disaccharide hydrolase